MAAGGTRAFAAADSAWLRMDTPTNRMRTPWPWSSSTSRSSALRNSSISAPTSSGGRCQFSLENANRVSARMPRRRQNSIALRTAFWPA